MGSSCFLSSLLFPCSFVPHPIPGQLLGLGDRKPHSELFSCVLLRLLLLCKVHTRCCTPPNQGRMLPLLKGTPSFHHSFVFVFSCLCFQTLGNEEKIQVMLVERVVKTAGGWELMHVAPDFQPAISKQFVRQFIWCTSSDLPCQAQLGNKLLAKSASCLHCISNGN